MVVASKEREVMSSSIVVFALFQQHGSYFMMASKVVQKMRSEAEKVCTVST
jgi:hypothetical protein